MGRHATDERRRGIAAWPIMAAIAVVLVAAAAVTYVLVTRKSTAAEGCTGQVTLQVSVSPSVADAVTQAAVAFDATKPVARSACVTTVVTPRSGPATAAALAAGWKGADGPAPAYWVVDSSADLATVDKADSSLTAGRSTSPVATSPVVVAVRGDSPLAAATLSWKDLPAVAAARQLPGGATFRLALADPAGDLATRAAVLSVLGSDGAIDSAALTAAGPQLAALAGSAPAQRPTDGAAAATTLAGGGTGFDAVPVLEAQLAAVNQAGAAHQLTAVYPTGPTAGAELMTAVLKGAWVDQTTGAAAALFDSFLSDPQGKQILADRGFRVPGTTAAKSLPGVDTSHPVTALAAPAPEVLVALSGALTGATPDPSTPATSSATASSATLAPVSASTVPSSSTRSSTSTPAPSSPKPSPSPTPLPSPPGPVITVVADTSSAMSTVVNDKNRNEWLQGALTGLATGHPTADLGLWTVSTDDGDAGYQQRVSTGPLTAKVGTGTRAQAFAAATSALTPSGSSWIYGAIRAAYTDAAAHAVPGRVNKVIVVVSASDSTPSLARADLLAALQQAAGKGVTLEIIGLSDSVNTDAMTQIAAAGGGSYRPISATDLATTLSGLAD